MSEYNKLVSDVLEEQDKIDPNIVNQISYNQIGYIVAVNALQGLSEMMVDEMDEAEYNKIVAEWPGENGHDAARWIALKRYLEDDSDYSDLLDEHCKSISWDANEVLMNHKKLVLRGFALQLKFPQVFKDVVVSTNLDF